MPNPICCGNVLRSEASEVRPDDPPPRTKNCYIDGNPGGPGVFDYSNCGGGRTACTGGTIPNEGKPGCEKCVATDSGGYCKTEDGRYYSSFGGISFHELDVEDFAKLGNTSNDSNQVSRAINNYDRMMTNRIRELQIMGKNPLQAEGVRGAGSAGGAGGAGGAGNEVHSVVGDMLLNIGMGTAFIMFLISISIFLIQKKII